MPLPRFVDYSLRFIAPISLALAIYYHYQSVQERVPTYYVSPTRARIVDTSIPAPPQMRVLYKGKDLNANVSAAVVYFWNDGKLSIKAEDILEPLKIELDPGCEIIDARILKVSRAVTRFAKGEVSDGAKNALPLSFGILERNDGAVLQIIYTGKPDARVSASGIVIGVGRPRESAPEQERPPQKNWRLKVFILMTFVVAFTAFMTTRFIRRFGTTEGRIGKWKATAFVIGMSVGMILPAATLAAYEAWKSQPTVPSTIWTENQK